MGPSRVALSLVLALCAGAAVRAQESSEPPGTQPIDPPPPPGQPGEVAPAGTPEAPMDRWISLEDKPPPEPPLFKVHAGLIGWVECRTAIRADRAGLIGTTLDDLERDQGLDSAGFAPWIEASVGGTIRVGGDASYFGRGGSLTRQDEQVAFNGRIVAEPGGFIEPQFELLNLGLFLEWDFLYDSTYRIGLVGGVRYFKFDLHLKSLVSPTSTGFLKTEANGELVSPYFGGLVELTPFPYLSVLARIEFMNWSWEAIDLREARYFMLRLGPTIHVIPERLSIGVEFRFSRIRAEGNDPGGSRLDGEIGTSGVAVILNVDF